MSLSIGSNKNCNFDNTALINIDRENIENAFYKICKYNAIIESSQCATPSIIFINYLNNQNLVSLQKEMFFSASIVNSV